MIAFFFYGASCLLSTHMVTEFERYRLPHLRKLTGSLQLAGALGLFVGEFYPGLSVLASGGLGLLMLFGIAARVRIGDPIRSTLPALTLLLLNAYIAAFALLSQRPDAG